MSSCLNDCADTIRTRDEEDFSVPLDNVDRIEYVSFHQDTLVPSTCAIELSSLKQHNNATELIMCTDRESNVCLINTEEVLHNVVPY